MLNLKLDREMVKKILTEAGRISTAVILAVAILLGYLDQQGVPTESGDGLLFARPTESRPTPTPASARATATPLPTTLTPSPISSPTLALTSEGTPLPSTPPVATSTPFVHDVFTWHEAGVGFHHHGANPLDPAQTRPAIVDWLTTNEWGPLFSQVGNLWESSSIENVWPWPMGKHEGFAFLSEMDTGCPLNKLPPSTGACIEAYTFKVHALGNFNEFFAQSHSDAFVGLVCDRENETQCGIVATGGVANYGMAHAQYKEVECVLDTNPGYSLEQTPYRSINSSLRYFLQWSSLTSDSLDEFFPEPPNQILQTVWSNRPFSVPTLENCGDPSSYIEHTNIENRNNIYQVFTIILKLDRFPRPFMGFTNVHGTIDPTCTAPSTTCVPLYIEEGVPPGNAILNRLAHNGDPEAAPFIIYGSADTILLPPGDMVP